jgi:hypothetical protein
MPHAPKSLLTRLTIALSVLSAAGLSAAVLSAGGTACAQASAQATDDASTIAAARTLAIEGVKLAQNGHCEDAIDKLERAEALHHAPIVQAQLGECYIAGGKLVAGTELLRSVLREPLPAKPSLALRKSYIRAQLTLDAVKTKIARLTITVHAAGAAYANASVDGQPVPSALLGEERPTDPGEHVVEGAAPGYRASRSRVTLAPGQAQSVVLDLEAEPEAASDAVASAPSSAATAAQAAPVPALNTPSTAAPRRVITSTSHATPNRTAAYVSWAVGAVGLGLGAGFGIAAADAKSSLSERCPGNACEPQARADLDRARAQGAASTVFFAVGAVGAVLGTVLFFVASPGDAESPAHASTVAVRGDGIAIAF